MIKRTHLAIGTAIFLYFLPFVRHKILFIPVVLISSLLPDIDSSFSQIGKKKIFRPVQAVFKHRGALHSYTVCIIISLVFAFFYPIIALPFFLGYSSHLLADSFTVMGIRPLWPLKYTSKGVVKTGSLVDRAIFFSFLIFDFFLFFFLMFKWF